MSDPVIGKEVDGYRIQSVLGQGGMGTVYKAEDVNLSRTVAIKRINPGQQERESFIHRFRSEAQALARIDSTYIVGVYALRETDIGLLIVMEYVEGGTLKDPLEQGGVLAPAQAIPILEQTLQAFEDAHSAGVIHRDIKPENVMLTTDGVVKVTDFGIAKLRQPDSGETVTQGGQGGTLKYMSPEQISSIDDVDARSDVYSLGMTAYEILAGDLPFEETDTDFDIMRKVVEGKIPPPDEINPEIPSGLAQWIVGAIQKEQDDRYQSAEEMKTALVEADQQTSEKTVTQPGWEVGGDDADVDETQTVVPGSEDRTQTVVPGDDEEEAAPDPGGQTVMGPDTAMGEGGATQPAVPEPDAEQEAPAPDEAEAAPEEADADEEGPNWALVGGGAVALLLALVGGYVGFTQLGGGGGAAATATLSLTTAPQGATVLVNGDTAGTTPIDGYTMEAGAVQLQVRKEGYDPVDTTLTAQSGGQVALQQVALAQAGDETDTSPPLADNAQETSEDQAPAESRTEPASDPSTADQAPSSTSDPAESTDPAPEQEPDPQSGTEPAGAEASEADDTGPSGATGLVEVSPKPSGTVLVDGEEQPSGRAVTLMAGEHNVTCRHPRHGTVETTVTVSEGQTQTLSCYFEQEVTVTAQGPWGRIWVDRSNTGQDTPSTLSLGPGTHRIEVRRQTLDGFQAKGGVVKTERDGDGQISQFSGDSYQIEVEPSFVKVKHAVSFKTSGQ
jgi:serine/threonine protein kinase